MKTITIDGPVLITEEIQEEFPILLQINGEIVAARESAATDYFICRNPNKPYLDTFGMPKVLAIVVKVKVPFNPEVGTTWYRNLENFGGGRRYITITHDRECIQYGVGFDTYFYMLASAMVADYEWTPLT